MTRLQNTPKHRIRGAACALALAALAACDRAADPAPPHDAAAEAGLQQVLDHAVARTDVLLPGAAAWYRAPGHAPWSGSAGLADLAEQVPMRPDSRIRAGSILKTLVATVVLQHVEEGTLSLDDRLTELLPAAVTDRVANAGGITLRMLLNHTSGIPECFTPEVHAAIAAYPERVWSPDELVDIAAALPPSFEPGTAWSYSNTNYVLVGMVLDRAGTSWRAQVRARILAPLRMTATALPEAEDRAIAAGDAHGYVDAGGTLVDLTSVDPSMAGAAGGNAMITTVGDLATFVEALLSGGLFSRPETLAAMTAMVPAPDGTGLPHRYGLGLESYEIGGTTIVGNAGGAAGYATMMYRVPARDATLVTTVNASDLMANAVHVLMPALQVVAAPAP